MDDEYMCTNCGTYIGASRNFYQLDNDDYICCKQCLVEYAVSYFTVKVIKGRKMGKIIVK